MVSAERLLQRRQAGVVREALDGFDGCAVSLHGEHEARAHRGAFESHGARTTDAVLAADVRPGEAELVAEEVDQQESRLDRLADDAAVDCQFDVHDLLSARSMRTPVRCFKYAGDAWM